MKTIKERAIEYCKGQWDEPTAMTAYMDGATEQKAIDDAQCVNKVLMGKGSSINYYKQGYHDAIEEAYKWIKANTEGGVHPQNAYGFADRFLKEMEK